MSLEITLELGNERNTVFTYYAELSIINVIPGDAELAVWQQK